MCLLQMERQQLQVRPLLITTAKIFFPSLDVALPPSELVLCFQGKPKQNIVLLNPGITEAE